MSQPVTKDLFFKQAGEGHPVILIHGFPMSCEIWPHEFIDILSAEFKVLIIDLPGFGRSPLPATAFTIEEIAAQMLQWILLQEIEPAIVIGHSLGGYVALAMANQGGEHFAGLGLFHSTAFADSEEKRQSRDKTIEFVKNNGAAAFATSFIPPLFADKQHPGIARVKEIGAKVSASAVIGYTRAMRNRFDHTETLKNFRHPLLFIGGDKDPGIPVDIVRKQAALNPASEVHILENQSHMGMMEAPSVTANILKVFCRTCHNPNFIS